ncbi:MAG: GNAT family N-acetyltransferase [Bacteroidetes bacterium]|nr:GNAT family N-acetyltransferase [Bacteroidota bacterium]
MNNYFISEDKSKLQIPFVHQFLSEKSYWAKGRSLQNVRTCIENSLCFGLYSEKEQVGFARVVSDFVTVGYVLDVFIAENHRGKGLSKKLMQHVVEHPLLQSVNLLLRTTDAQTLYQQFGFTPVKNPNQLMQRTA